MQLPFIKPAVPALSAGTVTTPTVLQMEAVECGAACLGIILGYLGRFISLETLRVDCGVSRDGSKAASIVRVAHKYGCEADGYKLSADEVLSGPFPTILFWNFNHFVVLEGIKGSKIRLNDPAFGRRTVGRDEFDRSYSGITLVVSPGDEFERSGKPPRPARQLIRQVLGYRAQMIFVLGVGFALVIPGFIIPGLTGVFVNNILLGQQYDWLVPIIVAMIIATAVRFALAWLRGAALLRVEMHMSTSRSADFFWHILRLPSSFFALRYLGDIASRVTNVQTIAQQITNKIGTATVSAVTAVLLFALMALLDVPLAAVAIGGVLVNVVILLLLRRAHFELAVRLSVEEGKLFAASVVGLKTIETLKSSGGEDDFFGRWAGHHANAIGTEQLLSRLDQLTALVPVLVFTLTTAVALWIGGNSVMTSALTLGSFIAFQALFSALAVPVQQVVDTVGSTQQVAADLTRLDDVLNHGLDWRHQQQAGRRMKIPANPHLRLENVTFGYNPQAPALISQFNLDIKPGAWIALVGASGSGKSTIGKLVSGLYRPWSGNVMLDDSPLNMIDRAAFAKAMGLVSQDIVLFEGTLRDNLTLWNPDISQKDLVRACQDAQIFDLVLASTGGFDVQVEENGRNFSGGERQRIDIAAALARSPSVLILDEATSALDPDTEEKIMTALRARSMSCLVISHRLSTIRDCDEIIVLDGGQVVERGVHDTLMSANGKYARLLREGNSLDE